MEIINITRTNGIEHMGTVRNQHYITVAMIRSNGVYAVNISYTDKDKKPHKKFISMTRDYRGSKARERYEDVQTFIQDTIQAHRQFQPEVKHLYVVNFASFEHMIELFDVYASGVEQSDSNVKAKTTQGEQNAKYLTELCGNLLKFRSAIRQLAMHSKPTKAESLTHAKEILNEFSTSIAQIEADLQKELAQEQERKQKAAQLLHEMKKLGITLDDLNRKEVKHMERGMRQKTLSRQYQVVDEKTGEQTVWNGSGKMPTPFVKYMRKHNVKLEQLAI